MRLLAMCRSSRAAVRTTDVRTDTAVAEPVTAAVTRGFCSDASTRALSDSPPAATHPGLAVHERPAVDPEILADVPDPPIRAALVARRGRPALTPFLYPTVEEHVHGLAREHVPEVREPIGF